MILKIYWTILAIIFTGLVVYFNISTLLVVDVEKDMPLSEPGIPVKRIMAYSLNKQIELEGQEYFCEDRIFKSTVSANNSVFWSKIDNMELYVTSVTLDERLEPYHYLRIVGVIKGSWNATLYCQILTNNGHVRIMKSTVTPIWYEKWDMNDNNTYYNPVLISCRLPELESSAIPTAVSLSKNRCQFSHNFIQIERPKVTNKIDFTLCVKPLNFAEDISIHLVQWIEMSRILGAQYFHIFVQNVTKSTKRLLKWYKHRYPNMINLENFTPVEACDSCTKRSYLQHTWQRRRYEVVTYNKCFYSSLYSQFVVPLDIDEIIVPKSVRSWQDLVQNKGNYSSLIIQNVYFFVRNKNRFNRPFFLNENRRNKVPNQKGENGKSFISTKNTLTVFNHYALQLLRPGVIKDYFMQFTDVQLNHYKDSCNTVIFPECAKYLSRPTITDDVTSRYKKEFYARYYKLLNRLKNDGINIS